MKALKEHRFEHNPKEQQLVEEFIRSHSSYNDADLIVFGHSSESMEAKDHLSEREKDIVVSTIQWLGSPVGQGFLERCGFVVKEETK